MHFHHSHGISSTGFMAKLCCLISVSNKSDVCNNDLQYNIISEMTKINQNGYFIWNYINVNNLQNTKSQEEMVINYRRTTSFVYGLS